MENDLKLNRERKILDLQNKIKEERVILQNLYNELEELLLNDIEASIKENKE